MAAIEKLLEQHKEILSIGGRLSDNFEATMNVKTVNSILALIKELGTLLEEHLMIEDDFLYPALKKRSQENIRNIAHQFSIELGGIKDAFSTYSNKWTSIEKILQSQIVFISESKALLGALQQRIAKEEKELFTLYKK